MLEMNSLKFSVMVCHIWFRWLAGWLCVVPMTMAMTDYENTLTHNHIKDSNRKSSVEKCAEFVFNCYWFHPKLRDNSNTTTNNKNKQPKIVMPLSMIAPAPSFARCVRRRYNINICKISEYFWDLSRLSRIFSSFLRRRQKWTSLRNAVAAMHHQIWYSSVAGCLCIEKPIKNK